MSTALLARVLALGALIWTLGGCENEIARTEETEIKDDGTVKTRERTVTEDMDGDTTVTETETVKRPGDDR